MPFRLVYWTNPSHITREIRIPLDWGRRAKENSKRGKGAGEKEERENSRKGKGKEKEERGFFES